MKAVAFIVFVGLVVLVSCRSDKPDLKQLKADAARKKACLHDCAQVKYDPICAGKQGERPQSFGNECVMNNYNCENKETLHKISAGECPPSKHSWSRIGCIPPEIGNKNDYDQL